MDPINSLLLMVRVGQLNALADANQWIFHHLFREISMDRLYPEFRPLRKGRDRFAYNMMTGCYQDYAFQAFDYHYQIERRKRSSRQTSVSSPIQFDLRKGFFFQDPGLDVQEHTFSGVIVETHLSLKPVSIAPTNAFIRGVSDFFGTSGIQFESLDFNNQFHVNAEDPRWAFDVLPQSTLEFLLQNPQYCLEIASGRILAYRNTLFNPEEFVPALQVISGILDRLPQSVLRELEEQKP